MQRTSEGFQLVVEFCSGCGAGAGRASVAVVVVVVEAGSIVSVGPALLQHTQGGEGQDRKHILFGEDA